MMLSCVIFDWKRTLYNPDTKVVIKGAEDVLRFFKSKNIDLVLMGKGGKEMKEEVQRLGLKNYFREIIFLEGEKTPKAFSKYISKSDPKSTLIIGDRVRSELNIGKRLGATTIWVRQGKFRSERPENRYEPDFVVLTLNECFELLKGLV